jgi:hypothetical protein
VVVILCDLFKSNGARNPFQFSVSAGARGVHEMVRKQAATRKKRKTNRRALLNVYPQWDGFSLFSRSYLRCWRLGTAGGGKDISSTGFCIRDGIVMAKVNFQSSANRREIIGKQAPV